MVSSEENPICRPLVVIDDSGRKAGKTQRASHSHEEDEAGDSFLLMNSYFRFIDSRRQSQVSSHRKSAGSSIVTRAKMFPLVYFNWEQLYIQYIVYIV